MVACNYRGSLRFGTCSTNNQSPSLCRTAWVKPCLVAGTGRAYVTPE